MSFKALGRTLISVSVTHDSPSLFPGFLIEAQEAVLASVINSCWVMYWKLPWAIRLCFWHGDSWREQHYPLQLGCHLSALCGSFVKTHGVTVCNWVMPCWPQKMKQFFGRQNCKRRLGLQRAHSPLEGISQSSPSTNPDQPWTSTRSTEQETQLLTTPTTT